METHIWSKDIINDCGVIEAKWNIYFTILSTQEDKSENFKIQGMGWTVMKVSFRQTRLLH